jgi:carbon monoxide dehydrogenase subunit G
MAGHTVRVQRDILAEREDVWAVLTDLERFSKVLTSVDLVERVSGTGFEVGTRWRETRRMFGKSATEEMWVSALDAPSRMVVQAESKGTLYETVFELAPSSLGTRLSVTFGAETSEASAGQKLSWALLGPLGAKATKSALEQDLADIAMAVESNNRR